MSRSSSRIPVDVFNPGQVFACYGLIDLAELLCGNVRAGFADDAFVIEADGDVEPIKAAIDFIAGSKTVVLLPRGITADAQPWKWKWQLLDVEEMGSHEYPSRAPGRPAKLVARVRNGARSIDVEHWAEEDRTGRDNVKFWGGAGGLPGVVILNSAMCQVDKANQQLHSDPFNIQANQSSSLRLDSRSSYIPMSIGWSLNNHNKNLTRIAGYPLADILAAIGLNNARPQRHKKLQYSYGVLGGTAHPPVLLRAALGAPLLGFPRRQFQIQLEWSGQENYDRAITSVIEVTDKEQAE